MTRDCLGISNAESSRVGLSDFGPQSLGLRIRALQLNVFAKRARTHTIATRTLALQRRLITEIPTLYASAFAPTSPILTSIMNMFTTVRPEA